MALILSNLRKPINSQIVDPNTGRIREEWDLYFRAFTDQINAAIGALSVDPPTPAPVDAEYLVGSANGTLTAERVATDTTTIDADMGTAGQAKWNVLEVPGISSTGLVARTAAATYTARTLTGPAAGITVTNGNGVSGNPTLALADDLSALEAMSGTGLVARTASNTYAQRTVTAGAAISVTNGDGVSGNPTIALAAGVRNISDITSGDTIVAADDNKLVYITTGTGTLAFTAAATLGANFVCTIQNRGTGDVTLDPNSTEQIDGLTSWVLYPGGTIRVYCSSTAFFSVLLSPMEKTFNSSGTLTKPGVGTWCEGHIWGGGASGAKGTTNVGGGGGGGGGCTPFKFLLSQLGTTETVTIGGGGAAVTGTSTDGNNGVNSTLGSLVTGFRGQGGSGAASGTGGGGGGAVSAPSGQTGGSPVDGVGSGKSNEGLGGGNGNVTGGAGGNAGYGGGGGGGGDAATGGAGGSCLWGGGGGGAGGDSTAGGAGGTSTFGGAGGAGATGTATAGNGTQPGGGGGGAEGQGGTGNSGAGAAGRLTIRFY